MHTLERAKYNSHKTWQSKKDSCESTLAVTSIFFRNLSLSPQLKAAPSLIFLRLCSKWMNMTAGKKSFSSSVKVQLWLVFGFKAPICTISCTLVGLVFLYLKFSPLFCLSLTAIKEREVYSVYGERSYMVGRNKKIRSRLRPDMYLPYMVTSYLVLGLLWRNYGKILRQMAPKSKKEHIIKWHLTPF